MDQLSLEDKIMAAATDDIMRKIKKCLALSESSEPNEAAAALRQAQKLMELHGISQSDLKLSEMGETRLRSMVSATKVSPWEHLLMKTVADAFGCHLLWMGGNSHARTAEYMFGKWIIVGLSTQVPIAEYTASVLMRKLMKARAAHVNSLPSWLSRQEKTAEANGFCFGWIEVIAKTVSKFAKTEELNQMTRLYLESKHGITDETKKAKGRRVQYSTDGLEAGKEAARGESLHRPVDGAGETLRLSA